KTSLTSSSASRTTCSLEFTFPLFSVVSRICFLCLRSTRARRVHPAARCPFGQSPGRCPCRGRFPCHEAVRTPEKCGPGVRERCLCRYPQPTAGNSRHPPPLEPLLSASRRERRT